MKITNKTLMVGFQTEAKLGNNDAIELTLIHQAFISRDKLGVLAVDFDLGIDIDNVKFLGIDIDSTYSSFKQFKAQLLELGIDLNKLIEEKEAELIANGIENELKLLFRNNEL
jgi:hypothetical protein